MTRPIKVLHLITGLQTGGAEMMLYKLLFASNRGAFPAAVVSLMDRGTMGDKIAALGVPVYTLGLNSLWTFPRALRALRKIVRAFAPDVVQGWMYHANLAAQWAAWGRHIPVVWNVRHSLYDLRLEKRTTQLVLRLSRRLCTRPSAIIYNAEISARQHEAFGYPAAKRVVIANGFELDRFVPSERARALLRQELSLPAGTLLIGMVARYHPMKDHCTFLQAVAQLHEAHPEVHYVLAGRGVTGDNGDLAQAIESLKLKHIHLLGERSDMPALTAALDIATSASAYGEGFSNVLGEAMACGIPCVTTDVGDSGMIVADTGVVVPPRSPEALAAGWRTLLELGTEGRHALGLTARRRIEGQFSLNAVVQQYQRLYQRLVKGKETAAE